MSDIPYQPLRRRRTHAYALEPFLLAAALLRPVVSLVQDAILETVENRRNPVQDSTQGPAPRP